MAKFALLNGSDEALALAEAPSQLDAILYGFRHVRSFRRSITEAEFRRPHERLRDSFKRRYIAEGMGEERAEKMAEVAAGPEQWLPLVQVPKQPPAPRYAKPKPVASAEAAAEKRRAKRPAKRSDTPAPLQQMHGDAVSLWRPTGRGGATK